MFMEFSAQQIAMLLGGKVTGDANRKVWDVGSIENAKEGQLTFLCDAKYLSHLPHTGASVVQIGEDAFAGCDHCEFICPKGSYAEQYLQKAGLLPGPQQ